MVKRPEDFHSTFVEAFNSGDVESLVDLYEPEASLGHRLHARRWESAFAP